MFLYHVDGSGQIKTIKYKIILLQIMGLTIESVTNTVKMSKYGNIIIMIMHNSTITNYYNKLTMKIVIHTILLYIK